MGECWITLDKDGSPPGDSRCDAGGSAARERIENQPARRGKQTDEMNHQLHWLGGGMTVRIADLRDHEEPVRSIKTRLRRHDRGRPAPGSVGREGATLTWIATYAVGEDAGSPTTIGAQGVHPPGLPEVGLVDEGQTFLIDVNRRTRSWFSRDQNWRVSRSEAVLCGCAASRKRPDGHVLDDESGSLDAGRYSVKGPRGADRDQVPARFQNPKNLLPQLQCRKYVPRLLGQYLVGRVANARVESCVRVASQDDLCVPAKDQDLRVRLDRARSCTAWPRRHGAASPRHRQPASGPAMSVRREGRRVGPIRRCYCQVLRLRVYSSDVNAEFLRCAAVVRAPMFSVEAGRVGDGGGI